MTKATRHNRPRVNVSEVGWKVSNPELWAVSFSRNEDASTTAEPGSETSYYGDMSFKVGLDRKSERTLLLVSHAALLDSPSIRFEVEFRALVILHDDVPAGETCRAAFQQLLPEVVSGYLVPAIREIILSLSARSGSGAFVLPSVPITQFAGMSQISIPEPASPDLVQ